MWVDVALNSGWDCHIHVFDNRAVGIGGHYQPTERSLAEIEAVAALAGVGHLVLVQPSVYADDNSLLLNGLRQSPGRHRGVVVARPNVSEAQLDDWCSLGVRGLRFNCVSPVGNGAADFTQLAPRLKAIGLHAQWYAAPSALAEIAQLASSSGVACVLDHLAGWQWHPGQSSPWTPAQMDSLKQLADAGAWVKLSAWYRMNLVRPYSQAVEAIGQIAELFGARLLWASDWPHTFFGANQHELPPYPSLQEPVVQALGADRFQAALKKNPLVLYK